MSVEVRIPTILRTYTGGEKAVEGSGGTLAEVFEDLESRHPGLRERLVEEAKGKGANAIIAFRYDTSELGTSWSEVCAYGTAVRVRKR